MGASEEYKIEVAPIPLEERVKIEEQQLLTMIHQLNVSKKNSEDDSSDEDNLKGGNFSKRINNLSLSTLSDEIEIDENFINQNVITYDDSIKLIVLGEKRVGKSLLVQKLISKENYDYEYKPTTALDIKKTILDINNKKIKLEMIDTSSSMLNSDIIKTYYQLANGFVIVSDIQMSCVNEKITKIRKAVGIDANILLVINESEQNDKERYVNVKEYSSKNNISLLIEDIGKITNQDILFTKYIEKVLNVKCRKK